MYTQSPYEMSLEDLSEECSRILKTASPVLPGILPPGTMEIFRGGIPEYQIYYRASEALIRGRKPPFKEGDMVSLKHESCPSICGSSSPNVPKERIFRNFRDGKQVGGAAAGVVHYIVACVIFEVNGSWSLVLEGYERFRFRAAFFEVES